MLQKKRIAEKRHTTFTNYTKEMNPELYLCESHLSLSVSVSRLRLSCGEMVAKMWKARFRNAVPALDVSMCCIHCFQAVLPNCFLPVRALSNVFSMLSILLATPINYFR